MALISKPLSNNAKKRALNYKPLPQLKSRVKKPAMSPFQAQYLNDISKSMQQQTLFDNDNIAPASLDIDNSAMPVVQNAVDRSSWKSVPSDAFDMMLENGDWTPPSDTYYNESTNSYQSNNW